MNRQQELITLLKEATSLARQLNTQWTSFTILMEKKEGKFKKAA